MIAIRTYYFKFIAIIIITIFFIYITYVRVTGVTAYPSVFSTYCKIA